MTMDADKEVSAHRVRSNRWPELPAATLAAGVEAVYEPLEDKQ